MLKAQVQSVESEVPKVKYKVVKFQVLVRFKKILFINLLLKPEIKSVPIPTKKLPAILVNTSKHCPLSSHQPLSPLLTMYPERNSDGEKHAAGPL